MQRAHSGLLCLREASLRFVTCSAAASATATNTRSSSVAHFGRPGVCAVLTRDSRHPVRITYRVASLFLPEGDQDNMPILPSRAGSVESERGVLQSCADC